MATMMKVLQFVLLGLLMLIDPLLSSIGLLVLSFFFFQKHDWGEGFFDDKWGMLGTIVFLLGIVFYIVIVYIPSRA